MSRDSSSSELRSVGTDSYAPSLLQAEMELFKGAPSEIWQGVKNRGQQMIDNKALTALEIGSSAVLGASIALSAKNPGALGTMARYAPRALGALVALDFGDRVVHPMIEAGKGNGAFARKLLGANIGGALLDYPLMAMSGVAGAKLAPRVKLLNGQAGTEYSNAFYNTGDSTMVYGAGDGRLFASFQPKLRTPSTALKYDGNKGKLNGLSSDGLADRFRFN